MRHLPYHEKLAGLVRIGIALYSVRELDELLELILEEAMDLCGADGGTLYLVRDDMLEFHIARNRTIESRMGREAMASFFEKIVLPISGSSMAGHCALTGNILNIPDIQDTRNTDFRHNALFDQRAGYDTRSLLNAPLHDRKGKCVGVLQLVNAMEDSKAVPFATEDEMVVRAFAAQAGVSIQNAQLDEQLRRSHQETLFRLSSAAEYRDKETANHLKRMSHYCRILATRMELPRQTVLNIFHAAPLHDVGKLGIPDAILHKPGPLTPAERTVMETHALIGARILDGSDVPIVRQASVVALTHHEKWDGTGYPQKLSKKKIPLEGRIVALADVFDALSSRRCYKEAWPEDRVLEHLAAERAKHFDPDLVDAFLANTDEIREIRLAHQDSDDEIARVEAIGQPVG